MRQHHTFLWNKKKETQVSKNIDTLILRRCVSSTSWSLRYPPSSVFFLTFLWRKDGSVYSLFSFWPPSFVLLLSSFKAYSLYLSALSPTPVLLPGKSHGQRSLVGCSPWGHQELDATEQLHFHFSLSCIGEGNSSPLQWSCLENPRDGGAWWAAFYGVAQSQTRLKWLSSSACQVTLRLHVPTAIPPITLFLWIPLTQDFF